MNISFPRLIPFLLVVLSLCSCKEKKQKHVEEPYSFKGNTINNIAFAEITDTGTKKDLDMDMYMPQKPANGQKYPLTVFIHGGGFRVGEKEEGKAFCEMLADKGFVVASINYRTGWQKGKDPCAVDTSNIKVAVYRAMQDTRAALRFVNTHATEYGIDTNWIFISGSSAGGILSLATVYYPQDSANAFFGNMVDTLGLLDNYGNTITAPYHIKGMAAMWGGLNNPYLLTGANALPTIFLHGEKDNVVPYAVSHFYSCDNLYPSYGSKPLYDRLLSLGVPAEAYIDPEGGHGVYSSAFRARVIADFFHGIINKQPPTGLHIMSGKEAGEL